MPAPLALALAGALLLGACDKKEQSRPEEIRPVRVQTIGAVSAERSIELPGEVRARYETRLAFRVGGKITERLVEVGSQVRAGQPVARLDARDLQLAEAAVRAQVASAEADRNLAQADLKRFRELREKNFISQAEFERRQSVFDTAEARLESARAQYRQSANQAGYAVLTADAAGVITALEAEAGQVVAAGQTVARLAQTGAGKSPQRGELEVVVSVPESRREDFEKAARHELSFTALPGRTWKGRLRELSPAADPATRTYQARITVLEPGKDVELGMSARAQAWVAGRDTRVELPVSAIYGKGDAPQVWVVDQAAGASGVATVRLRPVKTGGVAGERVLIDAGLAVGDVVVVAGAQLLHPGQKVRAVASGGKP